MRQLCGRTCLSLASATGASEVGWSIIWRYVHDFALSHDDPAILAHWLAQIERHLEDHRLKLHAGKTLIVPTSEPTAFLGFELYAGSRKHGGVKAGQARRLLPQVNV